MQDAVIVSAVRTAVGKAPKGTLASSGPTNSARAAIKGALAAVPRLDPAVDRRCDPRLRDARGRAGPERRAHRQPARRHAGRARRRSPSTASARRGCRRLPTPPSASCAARRRAVVAGGTESMSLVPMGGHKVVAEPGAGRRAIPDVYLEHRPGRREPRARVGDLARGAGRVRAAQPPARDRRHRRRAASPTRSCR